ncbi:hypothetical protein KUTeg_014143 [Tegillarca granosa]|uniref:Uncharacterized protein n=1 Tax=Tegillarca granosa TaxID=220873 RepID=A0ABQ9EW50_TEGGR|nr:hypothetical protein KUTeg_014143 [Tegillarca granosa]
MKLNKLHIFTVNLKMSTLSENICFFIIKYIPKNLLPKERFINKQFVLKFNCTFWFSKIHLLFWAEAVNFFHFILFLKTKSKGIIITFKTNIYFEE